MLTYGIGSQATLILSTVLSTIFFQGRLERNVAYLLDTVACSSVKLKQVKPRFFLSITTKVAPIDVEL